MVFYIILFLSVLFLANAGENVVRVDLLHKNSLQSPHYNINSAQTRLSPEGSNDFVMKLSIGTPPVDFYGLADTGSDLIWTQCQPCIHCYEQDGPIFDPRKSSTHQEISCKTDACKLLSNTCPKSGMCDYNYGYGGGSYSVGVLSNETITFPSSSGTLQNAIYGCGYNNSGGVGPINMGIIGLGRGPLSLVSQMASVAKGKKFAQCLTPFQPQNPNVTSPIIFGTDVVGEDVVSIPLLENPADRDPSFWWVTFKGVSVGNVRLDLNGSQPANMFLDSGTPPLALPKFFYRGLESEILKAIPLSPMPRAKPTDQLCFQSPDFVKLAPTLTAHFEGGDVTLEPLNTFVNAHDDVYCMVIFPNVGDDEFIGIFGSYMQLNYLIGYNADNNLLSFKKADCTSL